MATSRVFDTTTMSPANHASIKQFCLIGDDLKTNEKLNNALEFYQLEVLTSKTGEEYIDSTTEGTLFILPEFEGEAFKNLHHSKQRILGPTAVIQLRAEEKPLIKNLRPLFSLSMKDIVICLSGFRDKEELTRLVNLVHYMGGSVRKELILSKVTHLVSVSTSSAKYKSAASFETPVMTREWIHYLWAQRHDPQCLANENMAEFRLQPFIGCDIAFVGFKEEDSRDAAKSALHFGGRVVSPTDPCCTHIVSETGAEVKEEPVGKTYVVNKKWFWLSASSNFRCNEEFFVYQSGDTTLTASGKIQQLPRGNKRKRLDNIARQLAMESPQESEMYSHNSELRRKEVSKLSMNTSFLDITMSPDKSIIVNGSVTDAVSLEYLERNPVDLKSLSQRHHVCMELFQTETNYVGILYTIIKVFKEPLEKPDCYGVLLVAAAEIKQIFGHVPPIFEVHEGLRTELMNIVYSRNTTWAIGDLMFKYAKEFVKVYPPFVNFFEKTKNVLRSCNEKNPNFHAFLKLSQSHPDCKRETLEELLIRPVQRLPSIILLLNDILKYTGKSDPDYEPLEKAISSIKEVLLHINEDKKKTEGQMAMFDIVNDIENCPPNLLSSHRNFITKIDVQEIGGNLTRKNGTITMFLFTDVLEICKKRRRADTLKSPGFSNLASATLKPHQTFKCFKHLKLIPLSHIKRVVDVNDTEDCKNTFAIVEKSMEEMKECLIAFMLIGEDTGKVDMLRMLCRHIANSSCCADAENILTTLNPQDLSLPATDESSSALTKAMKIATKTKNRLGRAFSMRRTPSKRELYNVMSSFMTPLVNRGPTSSSMCDLRHASSTNLTEVGANSLESLPTPEKKMKCSSLITGHTQFR